MTRTQLDSSTRPTCTGSAVRWFLPMATPKSIAGWIPAPWCIWLVGTAFIPHNVSSPNNPDLNWIADRTTSQKNDRRANAPCAKDGPKEIAGKSDRIPPICAALMTGKGMKMRGRISARRCCSVVGMPLAGEADIQSARRSIR